MRTAVQLTSFLAAVSLTACLDGTATLDVDSQAITGGALITTNAAPYDAALDIGNCTGAKIGDRRILTAAHCVLNRAIGDRIPVSNRLDASSPTTHEIAQIWIHPSYLNVVNPNHNRRRRDIAVLELTSTVLPGVAPMPIDAGHVDAGASINPIGYGCDESDPSHSGQKQIALFTAMSSADYLARSGASESLDRDFYASSIVYDVSEFGGSLCPGDSGGPVLDYVGGALRLVGVNRSRLEGEFSYMSRVSGLTRWIASPTHRDVRDGAWGTLLGVDSTLCVGVPGGSTAANTQLAQYPCDARLGTADNQYWRLESISGDYYQVVNGKSGKCMTVAGGSDAADARLEQQSCNEATNQRFWFVR